MRMTKTQYMDVWYCGRVRLQWFAFRLWQPKIRVATDSYKDTIALPFMSIQVAKPYADGQRQNS